jgi:hypothetical protein
MIVFQYQFSNMHPLRIMLHLVPLVYERSIRVVNHLIGRDGPNCCVDHVSRFFNGEVRFKKEWMNKKSVISY